MLVAFAIFAYFCVIGIDSGLKLHSEQKTAKFAKESSCITFSCECALSVTLEDRTHGPMV